MFQSQEEPTRFTIMEVWDSVEAHKASVKAKGARIVEEPEDKPWGYRQFTLEDVNGHVFYYFRFSDGVK